MQKLQKKQRRSIRRAPRLRSTNNEFDAFIDAVRMTIELTYTAYSSPRTNTSSSLIGETAHGDSFEIFPNSELEFLRFRLDATLQSYLNAVDDKDKDARRVSILLITTALIVSFLCVLLLLFALWCLSMLEQERQITQGRLSAQENLVKQQAHEMRQRFGPAISILEAYLNVGKTNLKNDIQHLRADTKTALKKLQEVENHHQLRLLVLKILRGNYELKQDSFHLGKLLHDLCNTARASFSHDDPQIEDTETKSVQYQVMLPAVYGRNINICTDRQVLRQIFNGLLSNAIKFTPPGGTITVSFVGIDERKRLVFQVCDNGIGIPEAIRNKLFSSEVTTGYSREGSAGLGLPSCAVFARCAGGYVHLVSSTCAENYSSLLNRDRGTVFQFAVQGQILNSQHLFKHSHTEFNFSQFIIDEARIDTCSNDAFPMNTPQSSDPTTEDDAIKAFPNNLTVVVVDDSAINRRCVIRSIRSASKNLCTTSNFSFIEFETVENAQPQLLRLASETNVCLTLDQSLESRGGKLTGSDALRWLNEINFSGCIISASGDAEMGHIHTRLGAHFVWGKPLPPVRVVEADLRLFFTGRFTEVHQQ